VIVVDCPVLVCQLIPNPSTPAVEALRAKDPEWCTTTLWEPEFASVLRKYERAGRLTRAESNKLIDLAAALIHPRVFTIPISRVLDVSHRTGCSTYDSYYIALAEDLNLPLFTYDQEVLTKAAHVARKP
jgi:predicted nucleic acid-binding protein